MIWRRWSLWSGQNKYRTALNGRLLSRRPRLCQTCSNIEEEDVWVNKLQWKYFRCRKILWGGGGRVITCICQASCYVTGEWWKNCSNIKWQVDPEILSAQNFFAGEKPSLVPNEYRSSFLQSEQPGHEMDHSPPSRAKVKNNWRYTFILHTAQTGTKLPFPLLRNETNSHYLYLLLKKFNIWVTTLS